MTTHRKDSHICRILQVSTIDTVASLLGRYGLVVVIGWIGALKFANFEANQIQPLVANSPFMGWLYDIFSVAQHWPPPPAFRCAVRGCWS
ncbi:MAG: DUF417 family protein [Mycobacterium sp.]|uniref:DUF417 family protein n=1 Tax=Mycobacterium sp. TaxID=1785 RepID=UPI003BB612C3